MPPKKNDASTFPTWDSMVADSQIDLPIYQLPLDEDNIIEIPCPDGASYLDILDGQRRGDSGRILEKMVPNKADRDKIIAKMKGVPFPIVDVLTGKVLRYYYGLSIESEEKSGNSSGS